MARIAIRLLVSACLMIVAGAAHAQTATAPVPPAFVNLAPLLQAAAHWALVAAGSIAYWYAQSHVKDQAARRTLLGAIENGVAFGANKVDGAMAGKVLNVQVGSAVVAQALKYVTERTPDAMKRLGVDPRAVVKMAIAKLPGVEGAISDEAIDGIVASVTGHAPKLAADEIVKAFGPMIEQAVAAAITKQTAAKAA